MAVGPATREVLETGLSGLNQLQDTLKMIPGCPRNVKVVGKAGNRIKLKWNPPVHNKEAVEMYVVWKRLEGGVWEEATTTKLTCALVKGLMTGKTYDFKVTATNSLIMSIGNSIESKTKLSVARGAAEGAAYPVMYSLFPDRTIRILQENSLKGRKKAVWTVPLSRKIATRAVSIALSFLTIPMYLMLTPGFVVAGVALTITPEGDLKDPEDHSQ